MGGGGLGGARFVPVRGGVVADAEVRAGAHGLVMARNLPGIENFQDGR